MKRTLSISAFVILISFFGLRHGMSEIASTYSYIPPFLSDSVAPMVMLTMARDHRLYYEAYNDASDINEDGHLDVRYNPSIDYYGYFDSFKYYEYSNNRFEPRGATINGKKAPNGNYWSGDYLNYLSMTRMDCMRKVLYGGYRSTDTSTETVLERAFIPQDAHSFGKEYDSIEYDGYDIREYTPLPLPDTTVLPAQNKRHLIATTALGNYAPTASPATGLPILRVLQNSTSRIWEWVATERPVVKSNFGGSGSHPGHPNTKAEFDTLVANYGANIFGTGNPTTINGSGNPYGNDDNYMTLITGTLVVTNPGTYTFGIQGDDAIDFQINGGTWSNGVGVTITGDVIGWYGGHGEGNVGDHRADITLAAGNYTIQYRHEEAGGGDTYRLHWNNAGTWQVVPEKTASNGMGLSGLTMNTCNLVPSASITDYILRVKVGDSSMPEPNCRLYPNGTYKPIGVLQRHGENDRLLFGLITGSYTRNLSGGVLRQPMGSIRREINTNTGEFLYQDDATVGGIIRTLDRFRIEGFRNDANFDYNENCGWIATRPLAEGECRMWGNPLAEMIYETTRYFTGAATPTSQFTYSSTDGNLDDNQLGLPLAAWNNPWNSTNICAKPIMLAISDIYPSYDSDQLPGSAWPTTISSSLGALNVDNGVQAIANHENVNGTFYIGQNNAPGNTGYNGACTPKGIPGFEKIRGLCPEEPSKQGSYYSAAVTHYATTHDLFTNASLDFGRNQTMASYMVALSSPLPEIRIPVAGNIITMLPFAKSVGGYSISSAAGDFQPTNTIVDFFVESINATNGVFRVNFEDVEQGADHDMDAIVRYSYEVVNNSTVTVTLDSQYAAGSIIQHMGYIISGTTADGTYLVVRDLDTDAGSDPDYYLDTPNATGALPLTSTISFSPGATPGANLLKNPLWYAAKWGGFEDGDNDGTPDVTGEWDNDGNGIPDTYFFVANPTRLEEQINKAFDDILRRTSSGTAASVISQSREGDGAVYQSIFFPEHRITFPPLSWAGQTHALFVDSLGNIREDSNNNKQLDLLDDKIIRYDDEEIFRSANGSASSIFTPLTDVHEISFLWSSPTWLDAIADTDVVAQRSQYNATSANRYIVTFADKDNDMIVDSGEIQDFVWPPTPAPSTALNGTTDFYAYLTLYPSFENTPVPIDSLRTSDPTGFRTLLAELARRQVDYIRGADQNATTIAGYAMNATRSRQYTENSDTKTWRLGDIVYSTPTVVGKPAENYNLIYLDSTYEAFLKKYRHRRQVVYVGANDGMLHAFNAGFYNSTKDNSGVIQKRFDLQLNGETPFPLGMEMWAYVPYNLLPHLLWLTDPNYAGQLHVSYMDLKPRVFDARVFFQADGVTPIDTDHPGGWGTIMVAGMRLGGGKIRADLDKNDGNGFNAALDRTLGSAYVIMDITNPEQPPTVLAEIRMPRQGFATCYPTVMPMATRNSNSDANNHWYLVFGSGPANAAGEADPGLMNISTSSQEGQLFVLDLKALAKDRQLVTLNNANQFTAGGFTFRTTEPGSFISDPIAVDLDIGAETSGEMKTDVIYYGTVAGDQTNVSGTMRRLVSNNTLPTASGAGGFVTSWTGNSTLAKVDKPVTAAPSAVMDEQNRLWVYFGAGRFFNRGDIPQARHMTFYGIKEPVSSGANTWGEVSLASLYNSTRITLTGGNCTQVDSRNRTIYDENCVDVWKDGSHLGHWQALLTDMTGTEGWRQDFDPAFERVLGQASILGGTVLFTSYTPSENLCEFEGNSTLWALFYKTGTAYYRPIFRNAQDPFTTSIDLGRGLAITPNVHVGDKEGTTAFIQTSTGAIETIEIANPFSVKSGSLFWRRNVD